MSVAANGHSDGLAYARSPRPKNKHVGLSQAYELREFAYNLAAAIANLTVHSDEERLSHAREFASLVRAWTDACDRIRIMRGRPLPGSLRPEKRTKRKRPAPVAPIRVSRVSDDPSADMTKPVSPESPGPLK